MGSLSPFTYYRRHKRQALVLIGLVTLVTLGLYTMVGVLDAFLENAYISNNYLTRFSQVYLLVSTYESQTGAQLDPAQSQVQQGVAQIRVHPDVAYVIPTKAVYINIPTLTVDLPFALLGVPKNDVQTIIDTCNLRLKEGRLPRPRTNELALSEEVARSLGLRIGDPIGRSVNERYYGRVPTEFVLVGTLENANTGSGPSVRLGLVSYEYLDSHEAYRTQPSILVTVAQEGRKAIVDNFLETSIASPYMDVRTYGKMSRFYDRIRGMLHLVFGVVDCLVAAVAAVVVGVLNRIALAQRLEEFGVLHAIGHDKKRLVRRVTLETAVVAGIGWIAGLAFSWLLFAWLKTNLFEPRGMELDLGNLAPLWFTIPIPLVVVGFVAFSVTRVFARLDPVAIIERGKLSMEAKDYPRAIESSARPLSSWTFYLRHRQRGVTLVVAMALMILGVAFPVFFFLSMQNAQKPLIEYLRYVNVVSVREGSIDPGLTAQIKTHPAVSRVIPAHSLPLAISIPPFMESTIEIYGVLEDDLAALIDLYDLTPKEGRLPRPRSNEIVVSKTIALNRGLRIGDKVGRPVYELDGFSTEMVVVGILQPQAKRSFTSGDLWLGFLPYEYQQDDKLYSSDVRHLLVVPVEGHKAELDAWLEGNVASTHVEVETYDLRLREIQKESRNMLLLFAIVESAIAIVAATALAILNYIFFSQRREEFGVLHAIGYSRLWLMLRAAREAASVIALAWLIGAVVCASGLILSHVSIYAPKGLSLELFDAGPWLFTLPIPLAVITASVATIARVLFRLDPVSIIERRQ